MEVTSLNDKELKMSVVYMGQIMAECDCQNHACEIRGYCMAEKIGKKAADRIEQLVKDIEVADDAINHWIVAYNNMESKLVKAVNVIKYIVNIAPEGDEDEWHIALDNATAMLAELEKS